MQVIKRDGEIAEFNPDKIYQAILKGSSDCLCIDR